MSCLARDGELEPERGLLRHLDREPLAVAVDCAISPFVEQKPGATERVRVLADHPSGTVHPARLFIGGRDEDDITVEYRM